jgi:hypothetical protein
MRAKGWTLAPIFQLGLPHGCIEKLRIGLVVVLGLGMVGCRGRSNESAPEAKAAQAPAAKPSPEGPAVVRFSAPENPAGQAPEAAPVQKQNPDRVRVPEVAPGVYDFGVKKSNIKTITPESPNWPAMPPDPPFLTEEEQKRLHRPETPAHR